MRSTAIYLASNLASAAVPFLLLPILVRLLSPAEYGQIALFQALFNIILAFVGINLVGGVKRRFFNQGKNGSEQDYSDYIATVFLLLFATTAIVMIVIVLLEDWLGDLTGFGLWILLLAVAVAVGKFIVDLRLGDYQVRRQPVAFGLLQTLLAFANGAVSLAIVFYLMRSAEGRIVGMAAAFGFFALVSIVSLIRAGRIGRRITRDKITDAIAFGVPLVPHTLGLVLTASIDRFFVAEYSGLAVAGIYAAGIQIVFMLRIVMESINTAFQPWVFERMGSEEGAAGSAVPLAIYRLIALTLAMGLAFAAISPLLVNIVLGEQYAGIIPVMPVLIIGAIFHGFYLYTMSILVYIGATGRLAYVTIAVGILTCALLFVLTPPYGAFGAATAVAVGGAIRALAVQIMAVRYTSLEWKLPSIGTLVGKAR